MDALLDTELRDQDVEGGIEDTNDLGLADDGPVALGQVGDKDTKVQVRGLLLRQFSRVALAVVPVNVNSMRRDDETYMLHCCATFATASRSMLNLGSAIEYLSIHGTTRKINILTSALENGVQLAMHDNVRIATNGGGEVGVEGDVEGVVAVLRDVQHAGAEVLRAGRSLLKEKLQHVPSSGILHGFD